MIRSEFFCGQTRTKHYLHKQHTLLLAASENTLPDRVLRRRLEMVRDSTVIGFAGKAKGSLFRYRSSLFCFPSEGGAPHKNIKQGAVWRMEITFPADAVLFSLLAESNKVML